MLRSHEERPFAQMAEGEQQGLRNSRHNAERGRGKNDRTMSRVQREQTKELPTPRTNDEGVGGMVYRDL